MKLRRLAVGTLLAVLVLCAGLLASMWSVLSADGPTEAAQARARARPQVRAAAPAAPPPPRPAPEGGCAVRVVVSDLEGQPLEGVDVGFLQYAEPRDGDAPRVDIERWAEARSDADGEARLSSLPCGLVGVWAGWGEGTSLRAEDWLTLLSGREPTVQLALLPSGLVRVRVVDLLGSPVPMASVLPVDTVGEAVGGPYEVESPGVFRLAVPAGQPVELTASAYKGGPFTHESYAETVQVELSLDDLPRADEDGVVTEIEIELPIDRVVSVHCLGQPDDSCDGVEPIQCTEPLVPLGPGCSTYNGQTACICPSGAAAVRGGGATVKVGPDDTEAWLDLSFGGAVTGRVVQDGQGVDCRAFVVRLPTGLEDLPRGGILAREADCDDDGRFLIEGVPPGDWLVEVRGKDVDGEPLSAQADPVLVRDSLIDVGDIDLWSGGSIEGVVLDGLTGEPLSGPPVVALRRSETGGRSTPSFTNGGFDGSFRLDGLLPGTWDVFVVTSPFRRVPVVVEEGLLTDGVQVTTAEASVLDDNGFELGMAESGGLVVANVDPDGFAAENGLQKGDEVVGVTLMGFDSTVLPPEISATMAGGLLGHWGGPGVGLVIDRGGVLMDVDLE